MDRRIESFVRKLPPLPLLQSIQEGPFSFYSLLWQDPFSRELERTVFMKILRTLKTPSLYFEYLTKQVASRDLEEGMLVPALGGKEFYYVYKKIQQGGLIAYALKPLYKKSCLSPILFFRPTQLSFVAEHRMETLMDNLSLGEVGYEGFKLASKELSVLMKDQNFRKEKELITLAGYSLAGAYCQRFLALEDHWKYVSEAFLFNAPGVDQKTVQTFADRMNKGSLFLSHTPTLHYFRTEGDLIDQAGERHIGSGVLKRSNIHMRLIRLTPDNLSESFLHRHISCYLQGGAQVEMIDLKEKKK